MKSAKGTLRLALDRAGLPWVFTDQDNHESDFMEIFQDWLEYAKGMPIRVDATATSCSLVIDEKSPDILEFEGRFDISIQVVEGSEQLLTFVDFLMRNAPHITWVEFDELYCLIKTEKFKQ